MDQKAWHYLSVMEMERWQGLRRSGAPEHGKLGSGGHREEHIRNLLSHVYRELGKN